MEKINDFGFTTEADFPKAKEVVDPRFKKIEELIFPLLDNLISSSDNPIIKWPNRKEVLEKLKSDIGKLTKS